MIVAKYHFASLRDLAQFSEDVFNGKRAVAEGSAHTSCAEYGEWSQDEMYKQARDGWIEGVRSIGDLPQMTAPETASMAFNLDVAGAFPCAAAFAADDPECMYVMNEQPQPKAIRLVIPSMCPARLDEHLNTYAGAVSALMQHIEAQGITTELIAVNVASPTYDCKKMWVTTCTLRAAGDPLDVGAVAFAVSPQAKFGIWFTPAECDGTAPVDIRSGGHGHTTDSPMRLLECVDSDGIETIVVTPLKTMADAGIKTVKGMAEYMVRHWEEQVATKAQQVAA